MKRFRRSFIIFFLPLIFTAPFFAQKREVTKADVEKLEMKANALLETVPHRDKHSILGYPDSRAEPNYSSIFITDKLPPDRSYTRYEKKSEKGLEREEWMKIGETRYAKEGDTPWKVEKPEPPGPRPIGSTLTADPSKGPEITVKYEYLGEKELNGIRIDVYQITTTRRFRRTQGDLLNPTVKTLWFDKNGRLLRSQTDTTNNFSKRLDRTLYEYEYDLVIKIEPPIR